MIILVKKALRDLYGSKLRTIMIVLAISFSVGLGIGMVNATKDAIDSFDHRLEVSNYEDIDIQFEMDHIDMGAVERLDGVERAQGRLFIETQASFGNTSYITHWISSPYHAAKPYSSINGYQIVQGHSISSPDAAECMVGNQFAKANNVRIGDSVSIMYNNVSVNLTVSGLVGSPEYIYVVGDAGWPQPSLLAPVFTTYEMTSARLAIPDGSYNELLVQVKDGYGCKEVKETVVNHLIGNGVKVTRSLLGTQEKDYLFSRADADGLGKMGWSIGIIVILVTAVVIYNSMSKLIASQRAYIGVMQALGGKARAIIFHYSLFGFLLGIGGSLLGIPLGIGISVVIVIFYAGAVGIISPVLTIYWYYPLLFLAIATAISTAAAFFGSLRVIGVGPREALTSQYNTQDFSRRPIAEKLFDLVARKRPIMARLPVRNLARHRGRTLVTVVSLALSLVLVFSFLTMVMGFSQPLEKNYSDYERWDLKASLSEYMDPHVIEANLSGTGLTAEPMLEDFVPVRDGTHLKFVHVQAFRNDSELRHFHTIEGKYDPAGGILIGSILADKMGLGVGDSVTFVLGNITTSARITGITGELIDDSLLMTLDQASGLLMTGGGVNAVILNIGTMDRESVENMLRQRLPVAAFAYTDDVIHGIESMLQGLIGMMVIFIAFSILAEVLFISTTVILNILDRETEFVSLRALGAKPSKIRMMIMSESLILLVPGILLGILLGYYTTDWMWTYMVGDLMYYNIQVPPMVIVLTTLIALASTLIAAFISSSHISKIRLVDRIRRWSI